MSFVGNVDLVISIFDAIEKYYPNIFKVHFSSLIDILVGWSIDTTVSEKLRTLLVQKISGYRGCWGDNLDYGLNFINNLVYDIEQLFNISLDPQLDPSDHKKSITFLVENPAEVDCIGKTLNSIMSGIISSSFSLEVTPQIHFFQSLEISIQWYLELMTIITFCHQFESWFSLGN